MCLSWRSGVLLGLIHGDQPCSWSAGVSDGHVATRTAHIHQDALGADPWILLVLYHSSSAGLTSVFLAAL